MSSDSYLGNPLLKKAHSQRSYTAEQVAEIIKCQNDPVYFATTYIDIITLDKGLTKYEPWDFQLKLLNRFHNNRFNICKLPRQVGKSLTVSIYLLWYAIFHDAVNIAILANKADTAKEIFTRKLQPAYENLPEWLQLGVVSWNKQSIELDNKSKIIAASSSSSSIRGGTFNIVVLDEFAFVENTNAEQFISSVFPVISSGTTSKIIMISTPNGLNHFYKYWTDALEGRSDFIPTEIHWSEVPGRDDAWKEQTLKKISAHQFNQEYECDFLGSSYTLISAAVLTNTPKKTPIISNEELDILTEVESGHTYVITVDVAEGVGQNYSAFVVIDITEPTHYVVAKYRSNTVDVFVFPDVIHEVAKNYNMAFILCETNVGGQVGRTLQYDLEYPNLLMSMPMGRTGFILGQGFSEKTAEYGVKMSKKTKREGCRNLKTVMETHKLLVYDYDIIQELSTFIQKRDSYQADDGCNDDLCMALVLYGWMVTQDYFKELTDQDIRKKISEENKDKLDNDLMPFGFVFDGLNEDTSIVDVDGDRWFLDEYGDVSTEMGYLHHFD